MKLYLGIAATLLSFLYLILKSQQWKKATDRQAYKENLAQQAKEYQYSAEDTELLSREQFNVNPSLKRITSVAGIVAVILIGATIIVPSPTQSSGSSETRSDIFGDNMPLKAKTRIKTFLKNSLNDPDSYESVKWYTLMDYDTSSLYSYSITHKFRSKNVYGGVITSEWEFFFDKDMNIQSIKNARTGEVIK